MLSRREAEVAAHVVMGKSNKEIAGILFICEKTVKFHLTSIYKKLCTKNRAKLIAAWYQCTLPTDVTELISVYAPTFHPSKREVMTQEEASQALRTGEAEIAEDAVLPVGAA